MSLQFNVTLLMTSGAALVVIMFSVTHCHQEHLDIAWTCTFTFMYIGFSPG
jgi:hypothetical protein